MTDRHHRPAPSGRPRAGSHRESLATESPTGGPPAPGSPAKGSPATESPTTEASPTGSPASWAAGSPATGSPASSATGSPGGGSPATGSKTIDTGLRLLEILREHPDGLTISELARTADVHRNAVSRHLTALRNHRLVARNGTRFTLGLGILELGAAVRHRLRSAADGALQALADDCRATAFISVLDTEEEVVALTVAEPRGSHIHVAYRPGNRHAVDRGAPGIAILSGRPPRPDEPPPVRDARRTGYSVTSGELQPGAWGLAVPIVPKGRPADASVGVVTIGAQEESDVAPRVLAAATEIARLL